MQGLQQALVAPLGLAMLQVRMVSKPLAPHPLGTPPPRQLQGLLRQALEALVGLAMPHRQWQGLLQQALEALVGLAMPQLALAAQPEPVPPPVPPGLAIGNLVVHSRPAQSLNAANE